MPNWTADSNRQLQLQWTSLEDYLSWVQSTVAPAAAQYGYRVRVEPIPESEAKVDRA